jgi:hypothetical protein
VSPLLPLIVTVLASAPPDHAKLEAGVDLYHSGDLKGSLPLLLDSLDSGGAKQRATARLYIGLIQHRTGNARDASASFKHALELWPQIRPPKGTPRATADAFEKVREQVAPRESPPPRSKPKRDPRPKPRAEEGGPEVLQPVEGDSASPQRDWSVDQPNGAGEDPLSAVEPGPGEEDRGVPVLGWVMGGVGAAAAIAGVTLAVLAGVNGKRALDEPEQPRAAELYDAANVQNKAALATFGAAGVLFGVAALTVTF